MAHKKEATIMLRTLLVFVLAGVFQQNQEGVRPYDPEVDTTVKIGIRVWVSPLANTPCIKNDKPVTDSKCFDLPGNPSPQFIKAEITGGRIEGSVIDTPTGPKSERKQWFRITWKGSDGTEVKELVPPERIYKLVNISDQRSAWSEFVAVVDNYR